MTVRQRRAPAVSVELAPTADGAGTTLAVIITAPVKRPARQRQAPRRSVLRDVFPVPWPTDPVLKAKAVAEYQYLRAAAGFCRSCPNRLNKWKHRCDACQAKERERLRASGKWRDWPARLKAPGYMKKRRTSKFQKRARTWLRLHGIKKGRPRKRRQQEDTTE